MDDDDGGWVWVGGREVVVSGVERREGLVVDEGVGCGEERVEWVVRVAVERCGEVGSEVDGWRLRLFVLARRVGSVAVGSWGCGFCVRGTSSRGSRGFWLVDFSSAGSAEGWCAV